MFILLGLHISRSEEYNLYTGIFPTRDTVCRFQNNIHLILLSLLTNIQKMKKITTRHKILPILSIEWFVPDVNIQPLVVTSDQLAVLLGAVLPVQYQGGVGVWEVIPAKHSWRISTDRYLYLIPSHTSSFFRNILAVKEMSR